MADSFVPAWLPMAIGSFPQPEPQAAWDLVLKYTPVVPVWPQLPRRSFLENMYVQYSEAFPGVVVDLASEKIYIDRSQNLDRDLERLYVAYLQSEVEFGALSPRYAAGLHHLLNQPDLLSSANGGPAAIKGQVTGPVSWGLSVVDQNRRPVLYDDILADAIAKHLRLKATWQEAKLKPYAPHTIMFVDEPYMSSFGSGFISLSRDQVLTLLQEVFDGISGLKGVHCCGNTDWSVLLETSVNILNLDAFEYAESLALYPEAVNAFLERGGIIAWGIVPAGPACEGQTAESLTERLVKAIDLLVAKGVPAERLLTAGLVTPSCGTGSLDPPLAEKVVSLTAGVSALMRARYVPTSNASAS
ncbi:MAG TPA: methionine synthase [Anaerolineae bacterium]|nr:methionine synthase [Anaerolineae bacterium]